LLLAVLVGLAYAVWMYLQNVQQSAVQKQDSLKSPSEKALKDFEKEK
jgi:hypothetical protein